MATLASKNNEMASYLRKNLPEHAEADVTIIQDQIRITMRAEHIIETLTFLRDDSHCLFKILIDMSAVDYPEHAERFEVHYNLLSLKYNLRVRVHITTNDTTPIPSCVSIYNTANWLEREIWDMYGIYFSDHPDLRRILSDYGFDGHPLRKDFPLTGYVQVRYDEGLQRVIYEPVDLQQNFRQFDFVSPWEGTEYKLPKELVDEVRKEAKK